MEDASHIGAFESRSALVAVHFSISTAQVLADLSAAAVLIARCCSERAQSSFAAMRFLQLAQRPPISRAVDSLPLRDLPEVANIQALRLLVGLPGRAYVPGSTAQCSKAAHSDLLPTAQCCPLPPSATELAAWRADDGLTEEMPLNEQRSIAALLTDFDTWIGELRRQVTLHEQQEEHRHEQGAGSTRELAELETRSPNSAPSPTLFSPWRRRPRRERRRRRARRERPPPSECAFPYLPARGGLLLSQAGGRRRGRRPHHRRDSRP